ncbi:MAG: hypothetical protein Kow0056_05010 [Coriobacteriia bacterium]
MKRLMRHASLTLLTVALTAALALASPTPAAAAAEAREDAVDPGVLVADPLGFDGAQVTIIGEVIGDRLHSGQGHVWVNVLGEQGVAVGVWVPREDTEDIEFYGDYGHVGDTVLVTGLLNASCELHGGDFDIHAASLEIIERGREVTHEGDPALAILGVALIVVAGGLLSYYRYRRLQIPRIGQRR